MIRKAILEASLSTFNTQKMGAIITKGGRILSSGHNKRRGYTKYYTRGAWKDSLHAERDAIIKLLSKGRADQLVGSTIYVTRLMADGSLGMSKPCALCEELIRKVGIKKVVYTSRSEDTVIYKIKDLL